jgi:DNA-binding transcriptional regulator YdaS (Cro superfamily)
VLTLFTVPPSKTVTLPGDLNMERAALVGVHSVISLAEKLGLHRTYLSQIRHGKRPMPRHGALAFRRLTGYDWVPGRVVAAWRVKS